MAAIADEAEAELSSLAETAARAFTLNKPLLFLIPLKADKADIFVCVRVEYGALLFV
jgi:hypothetical protein